MAKAGDPCDKRSRIRIIPEYKNIVRFNVSMYDS